MTHSPDLVPVGPNAYAVRVSTADGWAGVVVGSRRTLVLDAGKDPAEGRRIARAVESLGRPADLLAYSHGHWDHVGGGWAFGQAEAVAQAAALPMIQAQLAAAAAKAAPDETLEPGAGQPSVIVSGDTTFDLGGREAYLAPAAGHAPGAALLTVPDSGILYAGDTVVTAIPPAFADGNSVELEATLRALATSELEILVPGHGEIIRGRPAIGEALIWVADYLGRVRERVGQLAARHPVDEIVALVDYGSYVGDHLPADRHRMVWRHEQTVRRILAELAAGGGEA